MRSIAAVVFLIGLVASACGGAEDDVATSPTVTPQSSESATPADTPTQASPSPFPSGSHGSTLTYTDPTYGYSFEYPSSWYLLPEEYGGGMNVILYSYDPAIGGGLPVPPDKLKTFFWVAEGVEKPIEEWLADGKKGPGHATSESVLSQYQISLGGKAGLAEVVEADGVKTIGYFVALGGGRVFAVDAVPADSLVWPQFEPVLSSIRFAP